MPTVFISYRRTDEQMTGRIYDHLCKRFGKKYIFRDIDSIPTGANFETTIVETIANSDFVIAVIGPNWERLKDSSGNRRLHDPDDLVRKELETALSHKCRVVPTLVGRNDMPAVEELPGALRPLVGLNAANIRGGRDFEADVQSLTTGLRGTEANRLRLSGVLSVICVVMVIAFGIWRHNTPRTIHLAPDSADTVTVTTVFEMTGERLRVELPFDVTGEEAARMIIDKVYFEGNLRPALLTRSDKVSLITNDGSVIDSTLRDFGIEDGDVVRLEVFFHPELHGRRMGPPPSGG